MLDSLKIPPLFDSKLDGAHQVVTNKEMKKEVVTIEVLTNKEMKRGSGDN